MKLFRRLFMLTAFVLLGSQMFGQGSTTAGINGQVLDEKNMPLPGATVLAIHEPTGSQYGGITDEKGYFRIPNMQVGGPYTVSISFVGYQTYEQGNISLTLGQTLALNVQMGMSQVAIAEVEIVGRRVKAYDVFDGNRTGAETVVDDEFLRNMPTVARDLTDFTRLTPQASVGDEGFLTVAGVNNRYNAISIDGAVNNDVFGLAASGTNGGQTGASPISMDVIDQFQITLAPYDVRQSGFAGASINAVTKSGTNQVQGTAYYLFRNQALAGKTPTDDPEADRTKLADFTSTTYGASVGGPIIKNKLFFFLNAERMNESTPLPFSFSDYTGDSDQAAIEALITKLGTDFNYDPGEYLDKVKQLESNKFFVRLDYNLSKKHKLMLRHSYTKSILNDASASSSRALGFSNNYMYFPSTTNSSSLELKSNFAGSSNSLILSTTFIRDDRDPKGDPFPAVQIRDGSGTIYFGTEPYSTANALNQDILTITDNFSLYKGAHTLTFGTNNEFAHAYNLFMRKNFGEFRFESMDAFMNSGLAYQYERGYSLVDDITGDGSAAAADFNMIQLGLYAQDEWQVSSQLKVTYGIRLDMPIFTTAPNVDTHFNETTIPVLENAGWDLQGAQAGKLPDPQVLFSPRVGFNYDVTGDKSTQLRGGIGIFTSRLPLVWPGGSYTNNGVAIGGVYQQRAYWNGVAADIPFNAVWNDQYFNSDFGLTDAAYGGQVDLFTADFKFPQMFRANLGLDQKLPWGMIGTLELLYTKTINNMVYYNINVDPDPVGTLTGADNRPLYSNAKLDAAYTRIMLGTNTNEGYTYNVTVQLQKPFENGLTASLAYTFGRAYALNDATSSQNSSQWLYMENVNGLNSLDLSVSDFDLGHRVTGYVSYSKEYIKHLKTSISLFYNGQSGRPLSYTYYGYLNGNNEYNQADLIYIPASQSEIRFEDAATAADQWAALDAFISADPYLSKHRGEYAGRNAARSPFSNIFDLRVAQDLFVNVADRRQTLQLTFNVFNLGNMINGNWGRRYYVPNGNYALITFEGFDTDGTTPLFSFEDPGNVNSIDDSGINSSRWQAQLGLRYIF